MCVFRSLWGVSILYGPVHAALAEVKGTQHILFSIFCALLIPMGYHLSRSASDFSNTWAIIKNCIMSTYHDDDDELSNTTSSTSSQKLTGNTKQQETAKQRHRKDSSLEPGITEAIEMSSLERIGEAAAGQEGQQQVETNVEEGLRGEGEEEDLEELSQSQKRSKSKASSLTSSQQTLAKSKKTITASSSSCTSNNDGIDLRLKINDDPNSAVAEVDKVSTTSTTNPGEISTCTVGLNEADNEQVAQPDDFTINCSEETVQSGETDSPDPLPKKLQQTVNTRLKNDFVVSTFLTVVVFSLHCSTVFTVLQPDLNVVLYSFIGSFGFLLHYIIPQMRKHMPWLCFARPLLRQKEYGRYEVSHAPKIMWFEKFYIYMCMLERNILFPLLVISALTADSVAIANKYGIGWGALIVAVCGMKCKLFLHLLKKKEDKYVSAIILT